MSRKALRRSEVLARLEAGLISRDEALQGIGVSVRQLRRLLAVFRRKGAEGLNHGNQGRSAPNRLTDTRRARIVELARTRYSGFNDCHLAAMLAEHEGIVVGRETLRTLLRGAGIGPKRRRRPPRHHKRREPSPCRGALVQCDGSEHRWFGAEQPKCVLMAAVDDADGKPIEAFFAPAETSAAYFRLLDGVLRRRGAPRTLYHDGHSALVRTDGHWSLEEQLAGKQTPPQVGLALEELGITQIRSYCPEGRGRIERFFHTAQDRLIAELRLHGITTLEQGNAYLRDRWLVDYAKRFGFTPAQPGSLYRPTAAARRRKSLSFRYDRVVARDNTITLGSLVIPIPPGPRRRGYAKANVQARQHLDGTWSVYLHDQCIATHPVTPFAQPERYRIQTRRRDRRAPSSVLLAYFPDADIKGPRP